MSTIALDESSRPTRRGVPLRGLAIGAAALFLFGCAAATAPGIRDASAAAPNAEFDYDAYHASTIASAIRSNPSASPRGVATQAPVVKYRFRVRFSGEIAPIRPEVRDVIELWATDVGAEPEFIDLFQHEITVEEAGASYRFPVQEQLLGFLPAEVPAGTTVDLFAMLIGSTGREHVFLVNEFAAGNAGP